MARQNRATSWKSAEFASTWKVTCLVLHEMSLFQMHQFKSVNSSARDAPNTNYARILSLPGRSRHEMSASLKLISERNVNCRRQSIGNGVGESLEGTKRSDYSMYQVNRCEPRRRGATRICFRAAQKRTDAQGQARRPSEVPGLAAPSS